MRKILLIEPNSQSKFPPLGLMRLGTYHKDRGDSVVYSKGMIESIRSRQWDRIYISSLFTWDLAKVVSHLKFYRPSVSKPEYLVVGGVAATLMPDYIKERVSCRVITGTLSSRGELETGAPRIDQLPPDYSLQGEQFLNTCYVKTQHGCIRSCDFCAVRDLEDVKMVRSINRQIEDFKDQNGVPQRIVITDNNFLANSGFKKSIEELIALGFHRGAKQGKIHLDVDINSGMDVRLISKENTNMLSEVAITTARVAFDSTKHEKHYRKAIQTLAGVGFKKFCCYLLYNHQDSPEDLYSRMKINQKLNEDYGTQITGFPMKYIPTHDLHRKYVAANWNTTYIRGIQALLVQTGGNITPNPKYFTSCGTNAEEFLQIISMPAKYVKYREKFKDEISDLQKRLWKLNDDKKKEVFQILEEYRISKELPKTNISTRRILEHYIKK